jgi:hypothetical protein
MSKDKPVTTLIKVATAAAGHEEHDVEFEGALDLVRDYMSKGKWLNIVTSTPGKELFFTDFGQMQDELGDNLRSVFEDASEMQLNAGLLGG